MFTNELQVKHKTFGLGTVTFFDGKYFKVDFGGSEKSFVYPDAFAKFLTLADGTVSDEIKADLERVNEQRAKIVAAKNEENLRAMTHGIVIPGKENSHEAEDDDSSYKNATESE